MTVDGVEVLKRNCGRPTPGYKYFEYYIRPWIAFACINLAPFVLIICSNVGIITVFYRVRHANPSGQSRENQASTKKTYSQTTIMCIAASVLFLVCVTPNMVLLIGRPWWEDRFSYDITKGISNQIYYLNHSCNFILYCITGKRFRSELMLMLKRQKSVPLGHNLNSGYSVRAPGVYTIRDKNRLGRGDAISSNQTPSPNNSSESLDQNGTGSPVVVENATSV